MGSLPWPQLGAGGLLAVAVAMILSGLLVPRRALKDAQKERDKWEALALKSQDAIGEIVPMVRALVESAHTSDALLHSIVAASERAKGSS